MHLHQTLDRLLGICQLLAHLFITFGQSQGLSINNLIISSSWIAHVRPKAVILTLESRNIYIVASLHQELLLSEILSKYLILNLIGVTII